MRQGDSIVKIESYARRYNPRKAMLYAAVFPGAGQAYNKKYWKIPLVYGGFYGIGFAMALNQTRYVKYRGQLFSMLSEPSAPIIVDNATGLTSLGNFYKNGVLTSASGLKIEVVRNAVNRYRRDRDFCVVATFIFYMLQMVDAHVDAHLKEFDLNPQLKVSLEPNIEQNSVVGRSSGFGLKIKF